MEKELVVALTAAGAGLCGALIGAFATLHVGLRRLLLEFQLQDSAQRVARELLKDPRWTLRSFKVIRHHLGGFKDEELRQVLVRCGAIRFKSRGGDEIWGLIERNRELLGVPKIESDPANNDQDFFGTPGSNSD